VIRGADHPVRIRSVRWVRTNYPVENRGAFSCSDDRLNAIWKMCRLTADTCAMEHMTDCVGREQVLWMMDFRFQAPQHCYYFGDTALARKCFRQYAAMQLENGHIPCYGPSCRPKEQLLDPDNPHRLNDWFGFNLYFILAVREFHEYTRDRSFAREMYDVCARSLDYHRRHENKGFADLGEVPGNYYVDWGYPAPPPGPYAFHQAQYYAAMKSLERLALELNRKDDARILARRAARLQTAFFKAFADPRTGRVADRLSNGRRDIRPSTQAHAAVLRFFDDVPPKVRRACLDVIVNRKAPPSQTGLVTSLVVEALYRHGHGADALKLLRDYWGALLDAGMPQTPEMYDMTQPRGSDCRWSPLYSRCHSYSSMAGVILQQRVLGAVVEGKRVVLSPCFVDLDYARGRVPTVAGDVTVGWRRRNGRIDLEVRAPNGVTIDYRPGLAGEDVRFVRRGC
jgi:hypothetical protein